MSGDVHVRIRERLGVKLPRATRLVVGFEYEEDAERFLAELRERLEKFALTLHPEKTRLIEFGRLAAENRAGRGLGKPETFDFLGFKHISGRSRAGYFQLKRKSRRDRMRATLKSLKEDLRRRMHEPISEQGKWLAQVVRGYFAYHAVPTNAASLGAFRSPCEDTLATRPSAPQSEGLHDMGARRQSCG